MPRLTTGDQKEAWRASLGEENAVSLNGAVERLVSQFDFGSAQIQSVVNEASRLCSGDLEKDLWQSGRNHARPRLDRLASWIEPSSGWDDLVLPEPLKDTLRTIALHVRHRTKVLEDWGLRRGHRGQGTSVLFAGESGLGKTLSAEVLAAELGLDLYRIDLSQVVSKYIGETEKNLGQVFDAADESGVVLLFDEADALFGKRSEVKDSHDRYANIEVSYLLQRMEEYRGLAILTTNQKEAVDTAFLRRLRFVVDFPFPDAGQRQEIWRRSFGEKAPLDEIDWDRLGQLAVAGGNIRNIAVTAAYFAAEDDSPVRMEHVLKAAKLEYEKLDRGLSGLEVGGWI